MIHMNDTNTSSSSREAQRASRRAPGFAARRVIISVLFAAIAVMWLFKSREEASKESLAPLPIVATVPDFSLTGRDGRAVSRADLLGKVWIADFIFTTCAGPCPVLSLRMRSLQKDIAKYDGNVKTVSFSIDPTYDQPPVLQAYAKRHQADADLWWFLTCNDEQMMHDLVQKGFLQAVTPAKGGVPIIHSTQFVLIDRRGRIRSWYDGLEAASKPLILRDVERLLSEPTD